MVTGDVRLEALLVEVLYNASINPEMPLTTVPPHPTRKLFLPCYSLSFFSL